MNVIVFYSGYGIGSIFRLFIVFSMEQINSTQFIAKPPSIYQFLSGKLLSNDDSRALVQNPRYKS